MQKKDSKCLCVARSAGVESHKTGAVALPSRPSERWSMDLVADSFSDGRRFRTLTVVDDLSRKCPAIEVDTSISGARIVRVQERLSESHALPKIIVTDNGPKFTSRAILAWADENNKGLHFIAPVVVSRIFRTFDLAVASV